MKDGDYIVAINEQDVKWSPHDQVVTLIKKSGNSFSPFKFFCSSEIPTQNQHWPEPSADCDNLILAFR